jgi:putative peptidoglycan lipid II flippase
MTSSTNVKIARATIVLVSAGILAHILSLAKEIIVANYFGITGAMDAFCAALTFPILVNNVLLSAFGAIFIPFFIRYRIRRAEEAHYAASIVINYLVLILVASAVLLYFFAPLIIQYAFHGLPVSTALLAVTILRILSVTVVLAGSVGILTGIINAYEHFAWPAFSRMCVTGTIMAFVVFFMKKWGIYALAYGLIVGLFVQLLILVPVAYRKGYRYHFSFSGGDGVLKEVLPLASLYFIAVIVIQVNLVVDRVMASYLAPGSIAALGYAEKIVQVPIMVFAGSLATAVFPFFSMQVAKREIEAMKDSLAKSIRLAAFIFIPITAALLILAQPLITLLFQRGAFDKSASALTSAILVFYSLQLFFYAVVLILGRIFLALQDMRDLLKITVAGVIMNVLFNLIFMRLISPPAAGIALSTSTVFLIISVLGFHLLRKKLLYVHGAFILKGVLGVAGSTLIAGAVVAALLFLSEWIYPRALGDAGRIGTTLIVGGSVFMVCARIFKLEEIHKIKRIILWRNRTEQTG